MKTHNTYERTHPHLKMPILEILATHEEIKLLFKNLKKEGVYVSETDLNNAFNKSKEFVSINDSRFYFSIHSGIEVHHFIVTFYEYDKETHHRILRHVIDYAKKMNLRIISNKLDLSGFSLKSFRDH
ncbi:MAG: hypothetical protein ACFFB2_01805 [Promethearchaeota archaeon]